MQIESSRLRWLLVLGAVPPAIEAALLVGVGLQAARALAPQATAVWPYDAYHDLRWLLVYHNSWQTFVLGLLAVIVIRGLLSAGLTALAWPPTVDRPALRWLVWRNARVAALAMLIISPWAALSIGFSSVALSWYLIASLLPMLLLAPFLQRAGVSAGWWRGLPTIELFGWSLLTFAVLTVAGALISAAPGWWSVLVALAAGAVNGLLWGQTVGAAVQPARIRWRRVPVAPVAVLVVLTTAVMSESVIGVAAGQQGEWGPPIVTQRLPDRVPQAVIVLGGHNSRWSGVPPADPRVERFSYRGLDGEGRPLPYDPRDTHRSLDSSAAILAAQVEALHRRTRRPIALIGKSEGAMVARNYLDNYPRARSPVTAVMLFSPLVRPGSVYYPPPGHSGWGWAAGWELRALTVLANLPRNVKTSPDEPFIRSLLIDAPFYRNRVLCPVPGVRMIAFLPTVSAIEAPPGEYSHIPVFQVPSFHTGVIGRPASHARAVDFLSGDSLHMPRREYGVLQRLGAAWQAPPLALSLNPMWSATREGDPSSSGRICQSR